MMSPRRFAVRTRVANKLDKPHPRADQWYKHKRKQPQLNPNLLPQHMLAALPKGWAMAAEDCLLDDTANVRPCLALNMEPPLTDDLPEQRQIKSAHVYSLKSHACRHLH
jgi:hypothetical protein